MEFKNKWREYSLIILGLLLILAPFVMATTLFTWANVVLGGAVALVGAWPLFSKKKPEEVA